MATAHDFSFTTLRGEPYKLADLSGRPFVVVNTASKCGFTPQYAGLEAVWREYQTRGLVVVGVPSNDFGGQEPGTHEEISTFCTTNYGVDFPMMGKVPVTGPQAHPFFQWAAGQGGFLARPRWNFFKYIIGKNGQLSTWFSSITKPDGSKFKSALETALTQ